MSSFPTWWAFCQRPENDGQKLHVTPGDPGGATCFGFTFATWKADAARLGLKTDYATFTRSTPGSLAPIAQVFFWNVILGDQMPPPVAMIWADFHFTSGGATACLQHALVVEADGVVGTKETIPAILEAWAKGPSGLLKRLTASRIAYYAGLDLPEFMAGWTRRANDGLVLAQGMT